MNPIRLHEAHNTVGLSTHCRAFSEAELSARNKLIDHTRAVRPHHPSVDAKPFAVRMLPARRAVAPAPDDLGLPEFMR